MHPWRERLSRWFTPMARRCPISPNTITLIALLLNLTAAACLYHGRSRPSLYLLAIVFLSIGGWCDAFDGIVARVQEKSSRLGDFFDHVADRVSDACVAATWMIGSGVREELTLLAIMIVMLSGYIGTQIEATYGQRTYEGIGRGEFVLAFVVFPIVSFILATNGWLSMTLASFTIPEWLTHAFIAFAVLGVIQRLRLAARLERTP